jgi:DNA-binding transcriptional MerR regulator
MITISELSFRTKQSNRIIRHYTAIGLIEATHADLSKKRKMFNESQVEKLIVIGMLRNLGLNLNEIGCILNCKLRNAVDFKLNNFNLNRKDLLKNLFAKKNNINHILKFLDQP